ncbi:hypothetical protein [Joostella sp. CR20]|uniref:hypothetical protein n=1 Tax=Joostella sp. CR20 TaxID=2804312 RepID=UPI00313EBED7
MRVKTVIFTILFSGIGVVAVAQSPKTVNEAMLANNQTLVTRKNSTSTQNQNNGVYLSQVGDYNSASVALKASEVNYNLQQNGNQNNVNQMVVAQSITQNVTQQGANNYVQEIAYNPNNAMNTQTIQEGNNLLVEKYGSNSIGDNMTIKMTGNDRSVIVRNYK